MRFNKASLSYCRVIHVYVSMALLSLMIFFCVTGVTLNHPEWFDEHQAATHEATFIIKSELLTIEKHGELLTYLIHNYSLKGQRLSFERDEFEIFISDKSPGFNLSLTIDLKSGEAFKEVTHYGLWATLNDLHKGRNSGVIWRFIIDLSAVLMVIFSLTGLVLALVQRRVNKTLLLSLFSSFGVILIFIFYV